MRTQIDRDAIELLRILADAPRDEYTRGPELCTRSDLDSGRINDAVTLLVDAGHADWVQSLGTAPYDFGHVTITPRGRYESQRLAQSSQHGTSLPVVADFPAEALDPENTPLPDAVVLPPVPVGSPYGFTDEDWETVSEHKGRQDYLYTVLGHQFESEFFDTEVLRTNVESMMRAAVDRHNSRPANEPLSLKHKNLSAGYGEHLFNEIARDIIGADIAIFEVSDLNPNVMLEMGVALTWGVRVLPIKATSRPKPPSDVSGQTWADYTENASAFVDPEHHQKLARMVERAVRKKGRVG